MQGFTARMGDKAKPSVYSWPPALQYEFCVMPDRQVSLPKEEYFGASRP